MNGLIAAVLAGVGVHLLAGASTRLRPPRRPPPQGVAVAAVVLAGTASVVLLDGTRVVVALVALAVAAAVSQDVGRRRRQAAASRRGDQLLSMCESLAADLRAGLAPETALDAAAADWPELAPVAAAATLGSDVPAALRELARRPGASQVRIVAAAWQVSHRSGAGLAGALAMAADELRADRATGRVVATELAAAQATARLLAALPVGVLLLGSGLGGDPLGFLLGSVPGLACLCVGLLLEYAGLTWLAHIGDRVLGRR